jgi:hypothetical protein
LLPPDIPRRAPFGIGLHSQPLLSNVLRPMVLRDLAAMVSSL